MAQATVIDRICSLLDPAAVRSVVAGFVLVLVACGVALPAPAEVPIGGARADVTRENLAAARREMPGGLLEPGWLPDGFVLTNADYSATGDRIDSVDLTYEAERHYLHLWQGDVTPGDSGGTDPMRNGVPLEGTDWITNPLPERMIGRRGVVEFSTRLEDGRTVFVDSDLDTGTMRRLLESLYLGDG